MQHLHATVIGMANMQNLGTCPTTASGDVLTPAETMAVLGISRATLNRYVAAGRLQPVRLPSGHRRFPASAVEAILSREPWEPAS